MGIALVTVAFLAACIAAGLLVHSRGRFRILDYPGERSLHSTPVPRTGGLAIWAGALAGAGGLSLVMDQAVPPAWVIAALAIVAAVSMLDDLFDVSPVFRLGVHAAAAGMLVMSGPALRALQLPGFEIVFGAASGVVVTLLYIAWMTNLYNFMDGMDGLAGGMAVFGFGTLGLLGAASGDMSYAGLCWVIAAAAAGFLVWNLPPARIFMGDTGSSVLGLLAAVLSLYGDAADLFPLWIPMLVFSPFIVDATVTLVRRTLRGQRIWKPHRDHYYQRLVQTGWGHRRTMLWAYALMAVCCAAAMLAHLSPVAVQWLIIAAVAVLHVLAIAGVRRLENRSAPLDPVSRTGGGTG